MQREERPKPRTKEMKRVTFSDFWGVYPKRVGKRQAENAWIKARARASAEDIIQGAQRYKDDVTRNPEYTAYPATWLNGDRWLDDPVVSSPVQAVGESEYLPMRFSDLPEGITFSEFLASYATEEEREKAKRLGLKL
jgi:hypothetical protein